MKQKDDPFMQNRNNLPEEVQKELAENKKYISLLTKKIEKLETVNTQLNELASLREKEKSTLQNRLSFNAKSGLPNHHKIDKDFNLILENANKAGSSPSITVFIIKLDKNYGVIHKTSKSSISEWIIYQIGIRIKEELKENSLVYHTRDDEFIIILRDVNRNQALQKASQFSRAVNQPHIFSGYHITIGCHIGIAVYPEHGISKELLLHNADIALDFAKHKSKDFILFSDKMRVEVIEKMELQNSIIKALEQQAIQEIDKQFELHFQPLVEITELNQHIISTGEVGCEALIRWNHPEKGMISPNRFIPVAEETGLIMPIGNWVLYRAADQLNQWQNTSLKNTMISVNLSPRQFKDPLLVDSIKRIFATRDIKPSLLKLELTETCLMDDPYEAIEKMNILTEFGVKFCIDDFGTGYSSLNYLRKLPLHTLKIDRSFIENVITSKHDKAIIRAILSMSKEMGFQVIAEGVEQKEQMEFLYSEGCSIFQGFYFSEALQAEDFNEYARNVANKQKSQL